VTKETNDSFSVQPVSRTRIRPHFNANLLHWLKDVVLLPRSKLYPFRSCCMVSSQLFLRLPGIHFVQFVVQHTAWFVSQPS